MHLVIHCPLFYFEKLIIKVEEANEKKGTLKFTFDGALSNNGTLLGRGNDAFQIMSIKEGIADLSTLVGTELSKTDE